MSQTNHKLRREILRKVEKFMTNIPIDHVVVGTCGICGGPVTCPRIWGGVNFPPKTCAKCGATAQEYHGPVIPMVPNPKKQADDFPGNQFSM